MARNKQKISRHVLLFLILLPVCSSSAVGYLTVQTEPGNYTLLDSQLIAAESFENLVLAEGTYSLHVYNPRDFNWQDRGFSAQIKVQPAETLYYDLRQDAKLRVISTPAGVRVFADSLFLGSTPLSLIYPGLAGRQLTVTKPGYQDYSFTRTAGREEYSFDLRPAGPQLSPLALKTGKGASRSIWLDKGLIMTSLAGSWLSFLFKRKADDYYAKYLHSANPGTIARYYDRSVQFDRYAGVSFAVSLLTLGGYFYVLLIE